jgi:hypothetical protein
MKKIIDSGPKNIHPGMCGPKYPGSPGWCAQAADEAPNMLRRVAVERKKCPMFHSIIIATAVEY